MSYEIHAVHSEGAEPVIETGKRFISAFEGESGDGWVLSVDRTTHTGTLMSNEVDEPLQISTDSPFGDITMNESEILWLKACWKSILNADMKTIEWIFQKASLRLTTGILESINRKL